jgi:hypothetical protein
MKQHDGFESKWNPMDQHYKVFVSFLICNLNLIFVFFFINIFYGVNSKEIVNYFLIMVNENWKELLNHKSHLVS